MERWFRELTCEFVFISFDVASVRQMVSELFRKVQDSYIQQRELGWRGKGLRQQPSTAASHFLQSLSELTTRLERYQVTTAPAATGLELGLGFERKPSVSLQGDCVSLPLNHEDRHGLSETAGFFCKCQVRNMRVMTVMILITALVRVWNVFIWCKLNQPARTSNQNEWFFLQKPL